MSKRVILCFDGTWDKPDSKPDETNVCRIYRALKLESEDGWKQQKWYDDGVGTRWFDHILAGAIGLGLNHKILQGYAYLAACYEPGDEVCIYGFSRGAYTARSLVGFIRKCGLVRKEFLKEHDLQDLGKTVLEQDFNEAECVDVQAVLDRLLANQTAIQQGFTIYRKRDADPDTVEARDFIDRYSEKIGIRFLGVWDTVGALGIPLGLLKGFNEAEYGFHDVQLSGIVQAAYHAVAVDEHRRPFEVSLWRPEKPPSQEMEQRWFVGSHSDVGGGYDDHDLADITLRWMIDKSLTTGLAFDGGLIPPGLNYKGTLHDSHGILPWSLELPLIRSVLETNPFGHETIDDSVWKRMKTLDLKYHPLNKGLSHL